jgi:hypothetical protein
MSKTQSQRPPFVNFRAPAGRGGFCWRNARHGTMLTPGYGRAV